MLRSSPRAKVENQSSSSSLCPSSGESDAVRGRSGGRGASRGGRSGAINVRNLVLTGSACLAVWFMVFREDASQNPFDRSESSAASATSSNLRAGLESDATTNTAGCTSVATEIRSSTNAFDQQVDLVQAQKNLVPPESVSLSHINTDDGNDDDDDFCTLYMAPSTLGPNAGFGIFTAKAFKRGEPIKLQDGPSIPVTDPYQIPGAPHLKILGDKWWGELKGMPNSMRFEANDLMEYVAGFGSLPNFHPYLSNIAPYEPIQSQDDAIIDRKKYPGAGASSIFTGKDVFADRDIHPGEELFLNYGESYFDDDPNGWYENVPRSRDYYAASKLLVNFANEIGQSRADGAMTETERRMVEMMLKHIKQGVGEAYSMRSASLVPTTIEELKKLAEEIAEVSDPLSAQSDDSPNEGRLRYALAREMNTAHIAPAYLKEHGFCLDNIVRKPSTIPGAGDGGFAARSLKKGTMINPVPLYHVATRELLHIYPVVLDNKSGHFYRNETRLGSSSQLLTNYCFGHDESSLLLCPITSVMQLNHCSMRQNGGKCGTNKAKGPNAKLQWASSWHPGTAEWLQKSVDDIGNESERVLNLELVVTRDVEEGEELFLDYGASWEAAWDQHSAKWTAPTDEQMSVKKMNDDMVEPTLSGDLRTDRSPEGHVMTGCWYWPERHDYDDDSADDDDEYENEDNERRRLKEENVSEEEDDDEEEDDSEDEKEEEADDDDDVTVDEEEEDGEEEEEEDTDSEDAEESSWKKLSDKDILGRFASDGGHFKDTYRNYTESPNFWPCSIVAKSEEENSYTVRIFQSKSHEFAEWEENSEPEFLVNYPRESIRYFYKPYRSDHFSRSFRHFIGIDNDIWPEQWKNRKDIDKMDKRFRIGDRVVVDSEVGAGTIMDWTLEGFTVLMHESKDAIRGVSAKDMKLSTKLKKLDLDPFYG